jgi:hypothetical protein
MPVALLLELRAGTVVQPALGAGLAGVLLSGQQGVQVARLARRGDR